MLCITTATYSLSVNGGSSDFFHGKRGIRNQLFDVKELCKSTNPDEAIAYGAAVYAVVLSGVGNSTKVIVLVDITPLSLGISANGGEMCFEIPKNTIIPTKKNQTYQTREDNQTSVRFALNKGERLRENVGLTLM